MSNGFSEGTCVTLGTAKSLFLFSLKSFFLRYFIFDSLHCTIQNLMPVRFGGRTTDAPNGRVIYCIIILIVSISLFQ